MLYIEQGKVLEPHIQRIEELEMQAGIKAQADTAREGSLFPLGIDGEEVDPDVYFADESDFVRRGIRRAYFSVADLDVRRELIKTTRCIEGLRREFSKKDVQVAEQEVSKTKTALRRLPWGTGAFLALGCIALGGWLKGTTGEIGGAVFGLFIGLGYVWNRKGEAETALEQAEQNLKSVQRDGAIQSLHPEMFSAAEQSNGERDDQFDSESAYGNVLGFLEGNLA